MCSKSSIQDFAQKSLFHSVYFNFHTFSDDMLEENKHEDITYLPAEDSQEMELFNEDSQFSYPVNPINFY